MFKMRVVAPLAVAAAVVVVTSCVNIERADLAKQTTGADTEVEYGAPSGPHTLTDPTAPPRPGWLRSSNSIAVDPELKSSISFTSEGNLTGAAGTAERLYLAFWDGDFTSTNWMQIVAFDGNGEQRWSQRFDYFLSYWVVGADVMVFEDLDGDYETAGGILHRLSGDDGSIMWTHAADAMATTSTDYDGKAVMTDGRTVDVVDLETGKTVAKQRFDRVDDVSTLNTSGGFVAFIDGRAVGLDVELNEITDPALVADNTTAWYVDGGVLAIEDDVARFYGDNGISSNSLALLVADPSVRVVDPTLLVYARDGRCGTIRADRSVPTILWTSNPCFVRDARVLDDGRSYTVIDITEQPGDLGTERVHDTETGRVLIPPASSIALEMNGFFSQSAERGGEWYSLDGELVHSDSTADVIEQFDGGYLSYTVDFDTGQHSIKVYGD